MATLVIVRHGEAEGNETHRFIGQTQMNLTDTGVEQANAVAERLSSWPITRIVASDLNRAVATLEPLSERTGRDIEKDARLREIHNGDWSGLLPSEIAAQWPEMWADYTGGGDVARPSGERWRDVADRVIPVAEELLAEPGTTVIGTHGGPALILAMWASGGPISGNIFSGRLSAVHNASLSVIGAGPRLVAFNDVGHLSAIPDQRLPFE